MVDVDFKGQEAALLAAEEARFGDRLICAEASSAFGSTLHQTWTETRVARLDQMSDVR